MSTSGRRPVVIPIHAAPARTKAGQALSAHGAQGAQGAGHVHGHGHGDQHGHDHAHGDCCTPDLTPHVTSAQAGVAQATSGPPGTHSVRFRIDQMDCPTEERLIRQKLEAMAGVARLDFNLLARELTVHHTLDGTSPLDCSVG